MDLNGKTIVVTGSSRGIGLAIAKRAARDGANVVILAKTSKSHPKLEGTIYTAAEEVVAAGGNAIAIPVDVRSDAQMIGAIDTAIASYGQIDILVNNASALGLFSTPHTDMKRFDLMHQINTRGTFLCTKLCIPYLQQATNPHVLMISPPLDMQIHWFAPHVAYTIAKYGMSMCVLGMAEEFRKDRIAFNALWPRTTIATAAIGNVVGGAEMLARSRSPAIMADAAHLILTKPSKEFTGNFCIDERLLAEHGETNFSKYAIDPSKKLQPDFMIPHDIPPPRQ